MRMFWGLFRAARRPVRARHRVGDADREHRVACGPVDYDGNRFILTADGHVRAQLSDGTVISGDTFSVDLKLTAT